MNTPLRCLLVALAVAVASLLVSITSSAQKQEKEWDQWTKKEAEKIVRDSPWAQVQTDTNTSEMFFSPTSDPNLSGRSSNSTDSARLADGAKNQAISVKYVVRFFSARPVRQALVRLMELQQAPTPDMAAKLKNFADVQATDSIIVTVTVEATDQRAERTVMLAINSGITATLKNDTYLERNGKRLFLEEYIPPGKDGFGARFIFLRRLNEQPFIENNSGEVRFFSQFPNKGPKIDQRFKVTGMIYKGELEY